MDPSQILTQPGKNSSQATPFPDPLPKSLIPVTGPVPNNDAAQQRLPLINHSGFIDQVADLFIENRLTSRTKFHALQAPHLYLAPVRPGSHSCPLSVPSSCDPRHVSLLLRAKSNLLRVRSSS